MQAMRTDREIFVEELHEEFAEFVGALLTREIKEQMIQKLLKLLEPPPIVLGPSPSELDPWHFRTTMTVKRPSPPQG